MTTRKLNMGSLRIVRNVIVLVILILIFTYSMSPECHSCQPAITQVKVTKTLNYSVWTEDVMPAMVAYPGVHVVTSGTEDLETGETVVVYFFWCGERVFRFRNYISVLSAIYVIKPSKIVFLHTHSMRVDENLYNTWFQMLLDSVPNIVTRNIDSASACNIDISDTLFGLFPNNDESAIYIGSNTIMVEFPVDLRQSTLPLGSARAANDEGFLYVRRQQKGSWSKPDVTECVSKDVFDRQNGYTCLVLDEDLVPKDIWSLDTQFGEHARKLVYRHPKLIEAHQDFSRLAPRISHYFWFRAKEFSYGHYLSILSALYVAGLDTVYFHGEKPEGYLFEKLLQEENVTHIYTPEYKYIHNHRMKYTTFNSDIGKLYILSKYGGVAQDGDVFWTQRISDDILAYDAVVGFDWPRHGEFPEVFNLGNLIGKPNSFYFKALLDAMRNYHDDTVHHMAMQLPYKTYERYPSTLHTNRHLQVICWLGKCHPSWLPNYIQPLSADAPGYDFSWEKDTYSVHCTWPKPPLEMVDFETLKTADGLFAEIGRNILGKAGKL